MTPSDMSILEGLATVALQTDFPRNGLWIPNRSLVFSLLRTASVEKVPALSSVEKIP